MALSGRGPVELDDNVAEQEDSWEADVPVLVDIARGIGFAVPDTANNILKAVGSIDLGLSIGSAAAVVVHVAVDRPEEHIAVGSTNRTVGPEALHCHRIGPNDRTAVDSEARLDQVRNP